MTRWNELSAQTRSWIVGFVVVVFILIILAVMGYFSGSWAWWCPSHYVGNCQTSGCTGSNCPRPP